VPESISDLAMAKETRAVVPPTSSAEQIASRLESAGEMTVTSAIPPALATISLQVITSLLSVILIIEPVLSGVVTSHTSLVAGVLVSMKTPPQLSSIPLHLRQLLLPLPLLL